MCAMALTLSGDFARGVEGAPCGPGNGVSHAPHSAPSLASPAADPKHPANDSTQEAPSYCWASHDSAHSTPFD